MRHRYLVVVQGDVEPEKYPRGPYKNEEERLEEARNLRRELGNDTGLYRLDLVFAPNVERDVLPMMEPFSGAELDIEAELGT